jgi:hypothetical protein
VTLDVEDAGAVGKSLHDVAVPDFIKQRAWGGLGHGVPLCLWFGERGGLAEDGRGGKKVGGEGHAVMASPGWRLGGVGGSTGSRRRTR